VRRLMRGGHECVVADRDAGAVAALVREKATGSDSMRDLAAKLRPPRAVWLMVPAAAVDAAVRDLSPHLSAGDVIVDGGNSHYIDDIRRAEALRSKGIDYVDVGTSGGVWGIDRGFCLMIGGAEGAVKRLEPVFETLSPGRGDIPRTPGSEKSSSTAERGYLHCGASGAGHFVKMVHNGIEYGLMAAYAEGLNVLKHADAGKRAGGHDAETTPLRHPEHYQYDFNLAEITELWRRGSVIASWLLDLTAAALRENPALSGLAGTVSDSGEGRWTLLAAIEEGAPAPVLNAALAQRFASRGNDEFARRVLSAMRLAFGGHREPGSKS